MDFINICETVPGPSVVVRPPNLKAEENSLRTQADEVSNEIQMENNSFIGKNTQEPAQDPKLPGKIKQPSLLPTLPRDVDSPKNLKTGEDSMRLKAGEVSNKSISFRGKRVKKSTKYQGLPQKRKMSIKKGESPSKRKKSNPVPISQMVLEAMKALRKRNGASVEAILEYMKGQYKVNAKLVKRYVTRYLLSAVQKGTVEQLSGTGDNGRFKIKKAEKVAKVEQKLKVNQKRVKTIRK